MLDESSKMAFRRVRGQGSNRQSTGPPQKVRRPYELDQGTSFLGTNPAGTLVNVAEAACVAGIFWMLKSIRSNMATKEDMGKIEERMGQIEENMATKEAMGKVEERLRKIEENMATKEAMGNLEKSMRAEMKKMGDSFGAQMDVMQADIMDMSKSLKKELKNLEYKAGLHYGVLTIVPQAADQPLHVSKGLSALVPPSI